MDMYLIFTPFLLLGVIALLGFVGCDRLLGLTPITPLPPISNAGQNQIVSGSTANGMAQVAVSIMDSPKLVIATVIWPTGGGTVSLTVTGATFTDAKMDLWSSYSVQTSYAVNVPVGSAVQIQATLSAGNSPSPWYLCVAVYNTGNATDPVYSPSSLSSVNTNSITPITFNTQKSGDMIYSVAMAQTAGGSFNGFTGQLSVGSGFTQEQSDGFILLQDQSIAAAGSVSVSAGTTGTNTGRWYLLAMGITSD